MATLNQRLEDTGIPVRIANLTSIWTVLYTQPGRYNWMFQFYLRKHGLLLSWVGSGRIIMSLNYTDEEYEQVMRRFIEAALDMKTHAWWWRSPVLTNKVIKWQMLGEMLRARLPRLRGGKTRPLEEPETDNLSEAGNP